MIKVKNNRLDPETIEVINEILDMDINVVSSFRLMKIVKELDDIVKNKQKVEVNILKKYATKDEEGNIKSGDKEGTYQIENPSEFNEQINELMQVENSVDFEPIKISDLGANKISPRKLLKIDFLLCE